MKSEREDSLAALDQHLPSPPPLQLCEHSYNRPPKPFLMKLQQFERILSKELR